MTAALDPAAREPRDLTALSDTQLERFARHLLASWAEGRSSLLRPIPHLGRALDSQAA